MTDVTAKRYASLIREIGAELGYVRGWKAEAARRLGVHRTFVSRILSGSRTAVSAAVLTKACERLGIHPGFFYDTTAEEPVRYGGYNIYPRPKKGSADELRSYWAKRGGDRAYGELLQLIDKTDEVWASIEEKKANHLSAALQLATQVLSCAHVSAATRLVGAQEAARPDDELQQLAKDTLLSIKQHVDATRRFVEGTIENRRVEEQLVIK
jgi:transcriptional regulator with XRE-family HTH domain